ncbi:MAG: sulfonate ABC transporter ATP-binding protein [Candidatus Rokuibacteriota bacterium]|nr:MAG: sulfonate ABC transporter ATP-binding protein [Candidatus Rokubacteria bacterium]
MRPVKLQLRGVGLTYETRARRPLEVLQDISFDVREGEFVALIGPSGCGKTSLLRVLNGLSLHTTGEIFIDGRGVAAARREIATVFQSDSLFPWRTVIDNILLGTELRRIPRDTARETARSLVRLVGLSGFEGHYPHELSGGMRQRVNLARALAVDPAVLLMDEPFASLDAQTREQMQHELLRIWSARRKTVVFVTHQIDEAVYLADRVVLLGRRPGRVREEVTVALGRPRRIEQKRTPEFHGLVDHLAEQLQKEVTVGAIV